MVRSTQIARVDGLALAASVDDEQTENELAEPKSQVKMIFRRLNRNSEPQASIECGAYTLHYMIQNQIIFLCICDASYPRKLAFTYLTDLATEFTTTYSPSQYLSPSLRPYAFVEFDTFMQKTKKTYQDSRASANLDKLNDELKDVTKVMTKNIEDLLYRGDSLERMGDMSQRLREDSKKYKRAAVRINWELLLKQKPRKRITWLAFEAAERPPGVDRTIWMDCFEGKEGVEKAFDEARTPMEHREKRADVIIIDSILPLCHARPASFVKLVTSLIGPQTTLFVGYHVDIDPSPSSISPYGPTPLQLLRHVATSVLTVSSISHRLLLKQAHDRSMQPPSFGIDQGVDGVIHATGCNTVGEVVIDMEHRRKSGRGTLESFVLSSRRSDQHNRPYQNQEDPNPADGSICVLGTHRSFRRVEDTGLERGGDEDESTFKMDLTERQMLTREGVVLPHYDAQRLEQGVIGDGGKILYDLGEEDDFDEEEDEI